ncbi:MAG: transcription-repair coupling factor [Pirellulaceae bacterium]|jgi:transcription-repair coupling factor (superfamily II helicase)|nr:transcription-repair coupling factor [Pirellulaceae bacterium]
MEPAELDTAPRLLLDLPRCLDLHDGFTDAVAALAAHRPAAFDSVVGGSCALLVASLLRYAPGPLLVVCRSDDDADRLADNLTLFAAGTPLRLPVGPLEIGSADAADDTFGERLRALKHLQAWGASDEPARRGALAEPRLASAVVTSVQSLMQRVPLPHDLQRGTRRLATGAPLDAHELVTWLARHQYHVTSAVQLPGECAVRGGIIDIFAADADAPVRIELFGDQIESIRRFDIASQRSVETLRATEITVVAASPAATTLALDYLPPESWVLLVEPELLEADAQRYLSLVESAAGLSSSRDVLQAVARFPWATASAIAQSAAGVTCRLQTESVQRFSGEIAKVRDELDRSGADDEVYLIAKTPAELQRLGEICATSQVAQAGRLHRVVGVLDEGFRLVREKIVLISGSELFQRGDLRRLPRRRVGKPIDSFLELREGDLVVHLAHGIGRYRGLRQIDKHGRVEEHLQIEFHGGTHVYVPALRIGLIQKYVGGAKSRPALARIGNKTWVRQKEAAAAAVIDLAAEMLDLQAARQARPGISFGEDSPWQREFDLSFPYEETPDQLDSIAAIKRDMQQPRPMDRLLCGDVGYGKTELAMRAAFKAVDAGYQVAVLVPTTILAEQHFHTFRDRMAEFPFDIARLSRFCSTQEERQILEGLAGGRIDVVIGTHRLASFDMRFHNLGLIIIDEEQRFGVEVKERLKRLRAEVDVLTLTATPIPRTLHMSLVGVRDISNLETPPADRLAVETRVSRFDPALIRHAVLRELNRGGQIYFVHNRVQDIELLARRLQLIVPEASLRIAHGQMPEGQLERVMVDFVNHRFDLLLATTIVESGLDIPNANTIFVDEANRYGLADLHQLRGRVGRYKHHAYCYLLLDPRTNLTPNAARRLRAIEEFSDMGAGFAIAMRDLEIRGAGNLLGTQQSGHIATVGYELYCQLLEAAVRRLKQLPAEVSLDVQLHLPGAAYFPVDYVPDPRTKMELYRRLERLTTSDHIAQYRQELVDRFGAPPAPVQRLLELAELRIDAATWQISGIHVEPPYLVLQYAHRGRIEQLARKNGGRLRIVDDQHAYLPAEAEVADSDEILRLAKSVLRPVR